MSEAAAGWLLAAGRGEPLAGGAWFGIEALFSASFAAAGLLAEVLVSAPDARKTACQQAPQLFDAAVCSAPPHIGGRAGNTSFHPD
jgi:hypothetical protein